MTATNVERLFKHYTEKGMVEEAAEMKRKLDRKKSSPAGVPRGKK